MKPVAPVTKYDMPGGYRPVAPGQGPGTYSFLPPPNMISSQLGTEARPRLLRTGRRGAGSSSGSASGPAPAAGSARPPPARRRGRPRRRPGRAARPRRPARARRRGTPPAAGRHRSGRRRGRPGPRRRRSGVGRAVGGAAGGAGAGSLTSSIASSPSGSSSSPTGVSRRWRARLQVVARRGVALRRPAADSPISQRASSFSAVT